jgi:hypothetical protein
MWSSCCLCVSHFNLWTSWTIFKKFRLNVTEATQILWCLASYSLTHSLMELSPSEKPPIVQLLRNFPTFYGTRMFITVFTRALHWPLSWARSIHTIPFYLSKIHFNIVHPPTFFSFLHRAKIIWTHKPGMPKQHYCHLLYDPETLHGSRTLKIRKCILPWFLL